MLKKFQTIWASINKLWFIYKVFNLFRLNPSYADGIYNKGDIYVCMEKYEDAIICFTKAIEMRPEWPLYLCNRGK